MTDAMVQIDNTPCWVRLSAVQAVVPSEEMNRTQIVLSGGDSVFTETLVEDVMEKLAAAVKPAGPVQVPHA